MKRHKLLNEARRLSAVSRNFELFEKLSDERKNALQNLHMEKATARG